MLDDLTHRHPLEGASDREGFRTLELELGDVEEALDDGRRVTALGLAIGRMGEA